MSVKCEVCGKEMKNEAGLKVHCGRFHKVPGTSVISCSVPNLNADPVQAAMYEPRSPAPNVYAEIAIVTAAAKKLGGLRELIRVAENMTAAGI